MVALARIKEAKLRQRVCVYGPPKAGKTELISKLAEQYTLWWIDGEQGYTPLFKLPEEWQERIKLFCCHDREGKATLINTMLKVVTGAKGTICLEHGAWNCAVCASNSQATRDEICLNTFGDKDILVLDSISALAESALAHVRGSLDPSVKNEWDHWGAQGALVSQVLRTLQNKGIHICMATHEAEVELEDGTIKLVPVSGTRNASRNTGKYFDHVLYMRVANMKHAAGSATTYLNKVLTGSRLDVSIEGMKDPSLLPFFDPDHPVNLEAREKKQAVKVAVAATNAGTLSALAKLKAGQQKPQ